MEQNGNDERRQKEVEVWRFETHREKEIEELRAAKADLEKKNKRLLAQNGLLENARLAREATTNDPLESDFYRQQGQLWDLLQHKHTTQQDAGFFKDVPTTPTSLSFEEMDEILEDTERELESMLEGTEPSKRLFNPTVHAGSDLESLMMSGLKLSAETISGSSNLKQVFSSLSSQLIVRHLALAALREWVFYSDYPSLAPDKSSCSLLRFQRDIIMDLGEY